MPEQSASAFGLSLEIAREALRVTQGAPTVWTRGTDSGRQLACAFCPTCGSRRWHAPHGLGPTITVKAGSLDEPVDMSRAVHIWTARKMPGLVIPAEAVQFPGEPE